MSLPWRRRIVSVTFLLEKLASMSEARSAWGTVSLIKHSKRTRDNSAGAGRLDPLETGLEGFVLVDPCVPRSSSLAISASSGSSSLKPAFSTAVVAEWDSALGGSGGTMMEDNGGWASRMSEWAVG
jgi:hypothetical protein